MSNNVMCPKCLGTTEEFVKGNKSKTCALCKGKGEVHTDLSEDFISSLNVNYDEINFD